MVEEMLGRELAAVEQMLQFGQALEAKAVLKKLAKAHPKSPEVMMLTGLAERLLKNWPEAIQAMKKAVMLAPAQVLYREHYANVLMLSNDGRAHLQAIEAYTEIVKMNPDQSVVATNLLLLALRYDKPQAVLNAIVPLLARPGLDAFAQVHYPAACALAAYLLGDMAACEGYVAQAIAASAEFSDPYYLLIYTKFLRDLLAFRKAQPELHAAKAAAELHVVGESHALTPAHACIGGKYRVVPHLIMGAKAYFFTIEEGAAWRYALEEIIRAVPKDAPLVIGFGEVDCRPTEGIMEQYRRHSGYAMGDAIAGLCAVYVKVVKLAQLKRAAPTYIVGVPAPNRLALKDLQVGEAAVFVGMIRQFNASLMAEAGKQQLGFLDLYAATADEEGWAKEGVHIDHVHLMPDVVAEVFGAAVMGLPGTAKVG